MSRPPFSAIDFPLYDSLPAKDVLRTLEKPSGIGQMAAVGRLLRLMNEYMEMSSVMGEIQMERYVSSRKESNGFDIESDDGDDTY